ncbi:E3 ubiquitin-protein ligase Kcmf1-like [Cotesia typhae]|uniref:E3 ubiquitin-protein ligase Kcmf1-like n=1 Tax=Cotesia typhae TaxID=2053667 RepID=UPI003D6848DB
MDQIRIDFDLDSVEKSQSLTYRYYTRMVFTKATSQAHVSPDHPDTTFNVVFSVYPLLPGGEASHVTDEFANYFTAEDQNGPKSLISFLSKPTYFCGVCGQQTRRNFRSNMLVCSSDSKKASSHDSIDLISELLTRLSGVTTDQITQLHRFQMQLRLKCQIRFRLIRGSWGVDCDAVGSTNENAEGIKSSSNTAGYAGHHHYLTKTNVVIHSTSCVNRFSGSFGVKSSKYASTIYHAYRRSSKGSKTIYKLFRD